MRRIAILAAALGAACSTEITPRNPYDPATPPELQAKAEVRAAVSTGGLAAASGQPVAIRASGRVIRSGATDGDGAFVFDQLVPGSYEVEVGATGFAPVAITVALRAGDRLDLGTIRLQPLSGASAAVITGTVLLAGRTEHTGTLVEAMGRSYSATTTTSGAFRLDVIPGTYLLRVSHPEYSEQSVPTFTVAAGEQHDLSVLTLESNPATIAGHVDGELIGSLADVTVSLEGTSLTALSNAAGDFSLGNVPSGSYVVRLAKGGYVSATVPVLGVSAGALVNVGVVSLAVARGTLAGTAELAGTSDASGIVVEVTGTGRAAVTGADGQFRFDGLVAGVYEVSARRDGYQRTSRGSLTVAAGSLTDAGTLTLSRQGGALVIAEGAFTATRRVTLQLSASGVTHFHASEDPSFAETTRGDAATTWRPLVPGQGEPFDLVDADGEHVVYVQFSTAGTNPSALASAAVVLDRLAPQYPSVVIGDGSGWSRAADGIVSLTLSAQDRPAVPGVRPRGSGACSS